MTMRAPSAPVGAACLAANVARGSKTVGPSVERDARYCGSAGACYRGRMLQRADRDPPRGTKRGTSLLFLSSLALVEVLSWVVLQTPPGRLVHSRAAIYREQVEGIQRMLAPAADALTVYDPELGWDLQPGRSGTEADRATVNPQLLRSQRSYAPEAPSGVLRVAAFGDSFTFGSEVRDEDTWSAVAERARPELEIPNFGVPGYGLDQVLLRYRGRAGELSPHIVLIGVPPVLIERMVTVCSTFYSQSNFAVKPRFTFDGAGTLRLIETPIRPREAAAAYAEVPERILALGALDHFYEPLVFENPLYDVSATVRLSSWLAGRVRVRFLDEDRPLAGPRGRGFYNTRSEAYRLLTGVTDHFLVEVAERGATPVLLLLPDRFALERERAGGRALAAPYEDYVRERGYRVLNASEAFAEEPRTTPVDRWFMPGQHYSPEGNRIVGVWVAEQLVKLGREAGRLGIEVTAVPGER